MIQGQASSVLILNCEACQEGHGDRAQGNEFDSRLVTFSVMSGKPLTSLSIHFPDHKIVRMNNTFSTHMLMLFHCQIKWSNSGH